MKDVPEHTNGKPIINLPTCPVNPEWLVAVVIDHLMLGKLPALDGDGRPRLIYGATIHDNCPRRGHFENGEFVETFGTPAEALGWCLYKLGCKGPQTRTNCPLVRWNRKTSWCVEAGSPCIGCANPDWVTTDAPFLQRMPDVMGLRPETVGAVAGTAALAGLAVHGVAQAMKGRMGHGGPPEDRRKRTRYPYKRRAIAMPEASQTPSATPSASASSSPAPSGTGTRAGTGGGTTTGKRIVIDPVTRVEGHLRVEIPVEAGLIKDAWVSGGLYRGMEAVLVGRAPADAFYIAQRICGVCPVPHGHAATMAAESALKIEIPNNARIIRNLIEGAETLHSHILWFYTLAALDYVDVTSAVKADVAKTYELAKAAGTRVADFGAVRSRLETFIAKGQMSIFTGGWWGHPEYKLPPELNLIAVAHYLEALDVQAEAAAVIAVMGGKFPHFMTSLPGGTAWVATEEKIDGILYRLKKIKSFVDEALDPRHPGDRPVLPGGDEVRQGRRQLPRVGRVRGQEHRPRVPHPAPRFDPRREAVGHTTRSPTR